jgi:hypothetical protein
MKKIILLLVLFLNYKCCSAQEIIKYKDLKYQGYLYQQTLNKSFINKRMLFLQGNDSIFFNIKIAFDFVKNNIYDPGIFYNCTLRKDSLYFFELKKVSLSEIPKEYNSYYISNGVFSSDNKSKFTEVKKDTKYIYQGNNAMFIDINHGLYLIVKMTPASECALQN